MEMESSQQKAEEIKKSWWKYTEELYKTKILMSQIMMVWSLTESWALGTIIMNKASGGDIIPAELFKILKDGCY